MSGLALVTLLGAGLIFVFMLWAIGEMGSWYNDNDNDDDPMGYA